VKFVAGRANRRFEFQKSRQLFVRTHSEMFSVAAMCVSNEDLFARLNPRLKHSPNSIRLC
jgi:hypothetical protein